jgi:hypothetical protein
VKSRMVYSGEGLLDSLYKMKCLVFLFFFLFKKKKVAIYIPGLKTTQNKTAKRSRVREKNLEPWPWKQWGMTSFALL